jgi:hypothetical protein
MNPEGHARKFMKILGAVGPAHGGDIKWFVHLPLVNIEGGDNLNIGGAIPPETIVHQSLRTTRLPFLYALIIFNPLNQRTCAVSYAGDGDTYLSHDVIFPYPASVRTGFSQKIYSKDWLLCQDNSPKRRLLAISPAVIL